MNVDLGRAKFPCKSVLEAMHLEAVYLHNSAQYESEITQSKHHTFSHPGVAACPMPV